MPVIPLHTRIERLLQSGDMRLLYGVGVPLFLVVVGVGAIAIAGAEWLVAPLLLAVVALTAIVLVGFTQMLNDSDDGEDQQH
jgi:hypothetical protein